MSDVQRVILMLFEGCVLCLLSCLLTRRAHCAKNINSCFQKRSSNSIASKAPPIGMLEYVVIVTLPTSYATMEKMESSAYRTFRQGLGYAHK